MRIRTTNVTNWKQLLRTVTQTLSALETNLVYSLVVAGRDKHILLLYAAGLADDGDDDDDDVDGVDGEEHKGEVDRGGGGGISMVSRIESVQKYKANMHFREKKVDIADVLDEIVDLCIALIVAQRCMLREGSEPENKFRVCKLPLAHRLRQEIALRPKTAAVYTIQAMIWHRLEVMAAKGYCTTVCINGLPRTWGISSAVSKSARRLVVHALYLYSIGPSWPPGLHTFHSGLFHYTPTGLGLSSADHFLSSTLPPSSSCRNTFQIFTCPAGITHGPTTTSCKICLILVTPSMLFVWRCMQRLHLYTFDQ